MDAKLVVVGGEATAPEYDLRLPAVIGRSRNADIKIGQALISRKHCELYEEDGQLVVRDLGSLNGTFVGETRIGDPTILPPGAMLSVGSVTFQAVYGDMSGDEVADADTGEMVDFVATPVAKASSVEQTMEMTDEEESPVTEPHEGGSRDEGFDFGWLDNGEAEAGDDSAGNAPTAQAATVEEEPPDDQFASAEEDLELPDPDQNGAAGQRAHAPAEQASGGGDDDNLDDFFASLK